MSKLRMYKIKTNFGGILLSLLFTCQDARNWCVDTQIKKNRITRSNSYNKFKIPELENRITTLYGYCWAYTLI